MIFDSSIFLRVKRAGRALAGVFVTLKKHLPHPDNKFYFVVFGVALAAAAYFRFWAAPLSAGVDVPQFWAFAKVFQQHGLDFYRYADATLDIFPTKGWGFVYPPVWLLMLRLALLATPLSAASSTMVDSSWRLAMKTPIIAADLAIGCLIFWAVPGSKLKKLIFASLWFFHPTAWYNSAVFGQFDAIAAVLLLASVIMLWRGKDRLAFLLAGLAIMTKQHTFIPIAFMIVISARTMKWRRLLSNCAIIAGVAVLFSLPFIFNGNFVPYFRSFLFPGQSPGYQTIQYSFSGSGSLLTYLHDIFGWNTVNFMYINIAVIVLAILAALFFSYRRNISPAQGALIGFLIFLALNYRVNYQYFIIYIPLALLVASQTKFRSEKIFSLVIAMIPAVWLWFFNVSFWFTLISPSNPQVIPIFSRLHLTDVMPHYVYVAFALLLMCLFLAYIILTFVRWRRPANSTLFAPNNPFT